MASLNTSIEGPAISKAYKSIVDSPGPANPGAASSPTYGQWAIFSVQAPLVSAFQHAGGQESVLRVFRTGEGELADMADEFSEGKIQYGFVKVKDPNTTLQKNVLIAWCGDGVPERTKGYYSGYTAAIQKVFQGYHVQINARTDADLAPESIVKKVQDSSGSKYSGGGAVASEADAPRPPVASKPVFTPSRVGGGGGNFNPLGSGRTRSVVAPSTSSQNDGWGEDAPQPTRSQLEKVAPAYQRTTVDMPSLQSQRQEPSRAQQQNTSFNGNPDLVKGGYQPIGKVDINAIRREAKEKGEAKDERPTTIKGSYEPVGKVDINAIRARAQGPGGSASPPASMSPSATGTSQRSTDADTGAGRLSSLPKHKPTGNLGGSNFTGTRAPMPSFGSQPAAPQAPTVGAASKTFADTGGKTPAQQWAERKKAGGAPSQSADTSRAIPVQTSGGSGGWSSGYSGKKWGDVQTNKTGASAVSSNRTGEQPAEVEPEEPTTSAGGVSAMRDRFKNTPIPSAGTGPPPPMDLSSKPNQPQRPAEDTQRVPPPPQQVPRPDDEEDEEADDEAALRPQSPIRLARPVARTQEPTPLSNPEEEEGAPIVPVRSMDKAVPHERDIPAEPRVEANDPARGAGEQAAMAAPGEGKIAVAQYDYEKAEDNELELREGEEITQIDMVDEDWWMGVNSKGEQGLFPSNYVELVESGGAGAAPAAGASSAGAGGAAAAEEKADKTATAQYDYEAAEENELTFPEGAKITDVEFPDDDWWLGEYNGQRGLFPANYVELD